MSSESERVKAQIEAELESRMAARVDARNYILQHYGDLGFSEADRDEILGALGILNEEDLSKIPGLSEARILPRAGLGVSLGKVSVPRTPPTRGQ